MVSLLISHKWLKVVVAGLYVHTCALSFILRVNVLPQTWTSDERYWVRTGPVH